MKTSGTKLVVFFTVLGFVIAGCAQVPKKGDFGDVQRMVGDRVDYRVSWRQGLPEDREVQQTVDALLEKELTVDSAIQISLLNNHAACLGGESGNIPARSGRDARLQHVHLQQQGFSGHRSSGGQDR